MLGVAVVEITDGMVRVELGSSALKGHCAGVWNCHTYCRSFRYSGGDSEVARRVGTVAVNICVDETANLLVEIRAVS